MSTASVANEAVCPVPGLSSQEREQMILKFAPLVRYVVGRLVVVLPQVFDMDDLLGYGTIGLIEAVDRFDPTRGVGFESFATERIRGSVIDALRSADWIPRSSRRRAREIGKAFVDLQERFGRAPADEDVAAALGLSLTQMYRAMADAMCTVVSLQRTVGSGDDDSTTTLQDLLPDHSSPTPGQSMEHREWLSTVEQALQWLDEREKRVLSLYYERALTLREISEVLEISESRVWQLHARAMTRIRAFIETEARG